MFRACGLRHACAAQFGHHPVVSLHAFVDESRRNRTYLVAAALVPSHALKSTRQAMRRLLLPGQREIHMCKEGSARRRSIADKVARLTEVEVRMYRTSCGRSDESARQSCLVHLVDDLVEIRAHRLVIDSRGHQDAEDRATIYRRLDSNSNLRHLHSPSEAEPLLWLADVAGWCYGNGGEARRRASAILGEIIDVKQR